MAVQIPIWFQQQKVSVQNRATYAANPWVRSRAQRELQALQAQERDMLAGLGASRGGASRFIVNPITKYKTTVSTFTRPTAISQDVLTKAVTSAKSTTTEQAIIRPSRGMRGGRGQPGTQAGQDLIGRLETRLEELKRRRKALEDRLTVAQARNLDSQIQNLQDRIARLKAGQVPAERMEAEGILLDRQAKSIEDSLSETEATPNGKSTMSKEGISVPATQTAPATPSAPSTPAPPVQSSDPWYKQPVFLILGTLALAGGGFALLNARK